MLFSHWPGLDHMCPKLTALASGMGLACLSEQPIQELSLHHVGEDGDLNTISVEHEGGTALGHSMV